MKNYLIKVDDGLLYFLKEYHDIDASEAMVFFDDRVQQMGECEPNITENSRRAQVTYNAIDKRTGQKKWGGAQYMKDDSAKYYVLRGFYPNTNIPFKITAVYSQGFMDKTKDPFKPVHVKVIMGMKPHWSLVDSGAIDKYREHMCEATLLQQEPMKEEKIEYKYRNFKCMRPKGMELYRERNYEDKQRELRRIRAAKRRARKEQNE